MSDGFVMGVRQAAELDHAFERNGFTPGYVKKLSNGSTLNSVRVLLDSSHVDFDLLAIIGHGIALRIARDIETDIMLAAKPTDAQNILDRYVAYADAWLEDEGYRDRETGRFLDRAELNRRLDEIERPSGVSNPKDFRTEIVRWFYRQTRPGGVSPQWHSNSRVRELLKEQILDKDLMDRLAGYDEDPKMFQGEIISSLMKRGYTPKQATALLVWYLQMQKSRRK